LQQEKYISVYLAAWVHMDDGLEGDGGKGGWTTLQKIVIGT